MNVTSVQGVVASPLEGIYCGSKHALEAMSETLALEIGHFGLRVVIIEPGYIAPHPSNPDLYFAGTNNGGIPVPAVECRIPLCAAGGVCASIPDPAQEGDPCADLDGNNCYLARCAAGGCNQLAVCDPSEAPAVCRVTISDTIWAAASF